MNEHIWCNKWFKSTDEQNDKHPTRAPTLKKMSYPHCVIPAPTLKKYNTYTGSRYGGVAFDSFTDVVKSSFVLHSTEKKTNKIQNPNFCCDKFYKLFNVEIISCQITYRD